MVTSNVTFRALCNRRMATPPPPLGQALFFTAAIAYKTASSDSFFEVSSPARSVERKISFPIIYGRVASHRSARLSRFFREKANILSKTVKNRRFDD